MISPKCRYNAKAVYKMADDALYKAKQGGRNRTEAMRCDDGDFPVDQTV